MPHIFISYAKKDTRELALNLADALNGIEGVTVWVDRSLRAGKSWELQIQTEIDRCDVMVVLYSPDINRHKQGQPESYVLTEIAYAKWTAKKSIIPVMVQRTDPPISLTMEHYIDFTTGITLDDLVTALCDELGIKPDPNAATRPASSASDPTSDAQRRVPTTPRTPVSAEAVRAIIGEPFEWCEVPGGEFFYGDEKQKLSLPTFAIAKYPITYSQFPIFIDAEDGFHDKRWWDGLAADAKKHQHPKEQFWEFVDHPRENVSWYDAMAFCRWLSFRLGGQYDLAKVEDWAVRLPTEFEWEKAARGTDGRLYPYGDAFDAEKSNTSESGIRRTTPVTRYPQGTSPYGVFDMSGNVWEWCLTDYHDSQLKARDENLSSNAARVLRGGAFSGNSDHSRTATRLNRNPNSRLYDAGFRLVRCPV